jgi:hypothetical protein
MNELEQRPAPDSGARLEGRILAVGALLLVGIGFWQHYENYVEAQESRVPIASEQAALWRADGSTVALMPGTTETFAHPNIHAQVSDISWRGCRYR